MRPTSEVQEKARLPSATMARDPGALKGADDVEVLRTSGEFARRGRVGCTDWPYREAGHEGGPTTSDHPPEPLSRLG